MTIPFADTLLKSAGQLRWMTLVFMWKFLDPINSPKYSFRVNPLISSAWMWMEFFRHVLCSSVRFRSRAIWGQVGALSSVWLSLGCSWAVFVMWKNKLSCWGTDVTWVVLVPLGRCAWYAGLLGWMVCVNGFWMNTQENCTIDGQCYSRQFMSVYLILWPISVYLVIDSCFLMQGFWK